MAGTRPQRVTTERQGAPYAGWPIPNPCGTALGTVLEGQVAPPYDPFPLIDAVPCGSDARSVLAPGGRLTVHRLAPLQTSGRISLRIDALFLAPARQPDGTTRQVFGLAPFDATTIPRLALDMAPMVPPDRRISLCREGPVVRVDAPDAACHR